MSRWYGDAVYGSEPYKGNLVDYGPGIFTYEPNWINGLLIKYEFNTIIEESRLFLEQRKPLYQRMTRTMKFSFLTENRFAKMEKYLKYYHDKVLVVVPIFSEPMKPVASGILTGLASLPVTDLSVNFNLRTYPSRVLLIDLENYDNGEVKDISSINLVTNTINFSAAIVGIYTGDTTIVYPTMDAIIESQPTIIDQTDTITEFEITFKEFFHV